MHGQYNLPESRIFRLINTCKCWGFRGAKTPGRLVTPYHEKITCFNKRKQEPCNQEVDRGLRNAFRTCFAPLWTGPQLIFYVTHILINLSLRCLWHWHLGQQDVFGGVIKPYISKMLNVLESQNNGYLNTKWKELPPFYHPIWDWNSQFGQDKI